MADSSAPQDPLEAANDSRLSEPDGARENPRPPMTRGEKLRMGCGVTILILLAIIGITAGTCYLLWKSEPGYWKANREYLANTSNADKIAKAEQLERRVTEGLSDHPDDAPQTVKFRFDEVNAWFDSKYEAWAINQGRLAPGQLKRPFMITAEGSDLVLAARVQTPEVDQVVSVVLAFEIVPDGRARLQLKSIRGGKLPIPTSYVVQRLAPMIPQIQDPSTGETQDPANLATTGIFYPPVIKHAGRDLRLLNFKVEDEGIEITFKNERPKAK